MGWMGSLLPRDSGALGSMEVVQAAIQHAFPGAEIQRQPSGAERLAQCGVAFPEILRQHLLGQPAKVVVEIVGETYSMDLTLGPADDDICTCVVASATGRTADAIERLAQMAVENGWRLKSCDGQWFA
jgi:hypothetical protein